MASNDKLPLLPPTLVGFQHSFPVDVFFQIVRYLRLRDLAQLCATNLDFASTFLPLLYRQLRVKGSWKITLNRLFCERSPGSGGIPSRVNDLLSLSNVVNLTLNATSLHKNSEISLDRLSSAPIPLDSFTLVMDLSHLRYDYAEDYYDSTESDYEMHSEYESEPDEVLLGKFIFRPALSVLQALNPRLLVVQGESSDKPFIASFYVSRKTAKVIRSWSRLVLLQLKGAFLHTTKEGASHGHSHQMVPIARRLSHLPPIHLQIYLPPRVRHRLPSLPGVYGDDQQVSAGFYFTRNPIRLPRSFLAVTFCYSNEATRLLLEAEKEKWGGNQEGYPGKWKAHYQICSMEEARLGTKSILDGAAEAGGEENAGGSAEI